MNRPENNLFHALNKIVDEQPKWGTPEHTQWLWEQNRRAITAPPMVSIESLCGLPDKPAIAKLNGNEITEYEPDLSDPNPDYPFQTYVGD